jgi:hypothetical protein
MEVEIEIISQKSISGGRTPSYFGQEILEEE